MSETMTTSAKEEIAGRIQMGAHLMGIDLKSMSDEMLSHQPGGKARCGFDLIYEVALVNRMVSDLLGGGAADVAMPNGWTQAPPDYRSKEQAQSDLASSVQEMLATFSALPEERLLEEMDTPLGRMTVARLMNIMASHLMYHSGQLNYIQTLQGDDAFHWAEAHG